MLGPLNKSLFTQELELLTKCLLHASESAHIYIQNDHPALHVQFDDIDINLSSLYKKVNFNHIQLNEKDSATYIDKIHSPPYDYDYDYKVNYEPISKHEPAAQAIESLTYAEIKAIRNFTGTSYVDINRMLYGNLGWASQKAVIEGAFIASGLNKITSLDSMDMYTFRGESSIPLEQINHRIDLVNQGGGITQEPAFMSTSLDYHVAMNFTGFSSTNKCMVIFEDPYGKNISHISHFHDEAEFLLMPSTVMWDGYQYKDGIHFFHAKVVSPLESYEEPNFEDCQLFSKLLNWASEHGVATDFVTPYVKHQIETSGQVDHEENKSPTQHPTNKILMDTPIIEHEKQDWLACIDEILTYYKQTLLPQMNRYNEIFRQDILRFDDVLEMEVSDNVVKFNNDMSVLNDTHFPVANVVQGILSETLCVENMMAFV